MLHQNLLSLYSIYTLWGCLNQGCTINQFYISNPGFIRLHDVRKVSNRFSPLYPRWCKHGVGGVGGGGGRKWDFRFLKRARGRKSVAWKRRGFAVSNSTRSTHSWELPARSFGPGTFSSTTPRRHKLSKWFIALEGCEMPLDNTQGGFIFQLYFIPKTNKIFGIIILLFFVVNPKKNCSLNSCCPSFNSLFCSYTYSIWTMAFSLLLFFFSVA